jgi:heme oxygenase (biliverdin-IX-beta and delta-forming)
MLADELKERTRDVHADLEKKLVTHIQLVRDLDQYAALLSLMYGYYAALENRLDSFRHAIPDYDRRRKSHALVDDLSKLGRTEDSLSLCTDIPEINTIPQALGSMYVLEGSTLGGKVISKMLLKQLPSLEQSLSFFQGYRDDTMDMWQKFKHYLHQIIEDVHHEEAQLAAKETFVKFKNWIEQHDADKL